LREARKKIRLLQQENEVLRRAAAYLSQANVKLGQSPEMTFRWPVSLPATGFPSR
jgi:hypothetical protein